MGAHREQERVFQKALNRAVKKVVELKQLPRSSFTLLHKVWKLFGFPQLGHSVLGISLSGAILQVKIEVEFLFSENNK